MQKARRLDLDTMRVGMTLAKCDGYKYDWGPLDWAWDPNETPHNQKRSMMSIDEYNFGTDSDVRPQPLPTSRARGRENSAARSGQSSASFQRRQYVCMYY